MDGKMNMGESRQRGKGTKGIEDGKKEVQE
jgi:hypothetical protein